MEDDHREPVRRLFVAAAEITETAHEAAIAGQSEALSGVVRNPLPAPTHFSD